jgi:hypothetical protein
MIDPGRFQQQQTTRPASASAALNQTELVDDYPFFLRKKKESKTNQQDS